MRKVTVLRLDAIAYGVVIAILHNRWPTALRRWRYATLVIGLLLAYFPQSSAGYLLGSWWKATSFNYVSLGLALTMPWAVTWRLTLSLARAPIEWLAERSYCLYIVHLTFLVLFDGVAAKGLVPVTISASAAILTSALVAELSFRFFETPILQRRPPQFDKTRDRQARLD